MHRGKRRRMYQVEHLIAGSWGPGSAARQLTVLNPADGEPVTTVPVATEADVAAAVSTCGSRDQQ